MRGLDYGDPMIKKTCTKCGTTKPLSEFGIINRGSTTLTTPKCKECIREYNRQYYEKNREAVIARVTKKKDIVPMKAGKHYWWSL